MKHMVQKRNINEEIVQTLLINDNHIRGISKIINIPHVTIMRKLNSLLKENIVDFRREGRNKIFFLKNTLNTKNLILKTEINKRENLINKHPELEIIFNNILKETKEPLIVLFGSYTKGTEKKDSDIDIYVETKKINVKEKIEKINSKINVKIGSFDKDSNLIKEIIKNHIIIRGVERFYEKESVFD